MALLVMYELKLDKDRWRRLAEQFVSRAEELRASVRATRALPP